MTQLLLYITLIISSPVSAEESYGKSLVNDVEYEVFYAGQVVVGSAQYALANDNNDDDSVAHNYLIVTVNKTGYSYFISLSSEFLKNTHKTYPIRAPPINSYLFV